ncbi:MAG: (5-formylfuran-3-yl)methyl phosphate synthase [Archaeoglobaceae archaeon]
MKILISPMDSKEAIESIEGGADIIDVKNPAEGSLGASFPWIIREIKDLAARHGKQVSATIGDMEYKPGTASLAALGAAQSGADYIKIGLFGVRDEEEAYKMLRSVTKSVKDFDEHKKLVAAAYADHYRINSISPQLLPEVGERAEVDGIMIDTAIKDGKTLFDHMEIVEIKGFIEESQKRDIFCALAGSIRGTHTTALKELKPDIIGVRTAVCKNGRNSRIEKHLVTNFIAEIAGQV